MKRLFFLIIALFCLAPVAQAGMNPSKSALAPEVRLDAALLKQDLFKIDPLAQLVEDEVEFTLAVDSSAHKINAVLDQWYVQRKRLLDVPARAVEHILQGKAVLYSASLGKNPDGPIMGIALAYRMEEASDLQFYFDAMGIERPSLPVWHIVMVETDPLAKDLRLGTYLLNLMVSDLGDTNYLHARVVYQGGHPVGGRRWQEAHKHLNFQKVFVSGTDLVFFVRDPKKKYDLAMPDDLKVTLDQAKLLFSPMPAEQPVFQSI